jgi:hypothetical protein
MFRRALACKRRSRFLRLSSVRFSRRDNSTYRWPLMKLRSSPVTRLYSDLRMASSASPRCLTIWNLSNMITAFGA